MTRAVTQPSIGSLLDAVAADWLVVSDECCNLPCDWSPHSVRWRLIGRWTGTWRKSQVNWTLRRTSALNACASNTLEGHILHQAMFYIAMFVRLIADWSFPMYTWHELVNLFGCFEEKSITGPVVSMWASVSVLETPSQKGADNFHHRLSTVIYNLLFSILWMNSWTTLLLTPLC